MAGVRYDAYTLTKADGKGKWWEGYDPQELSAVLEIDPCVLLKRLERSFDVR